MVSTNTLLKFLELNDRDLKKWDIEQLRLLLGVLRYSTRVVQREINDREPLLGIKKNSKKF